MNPIIVPISVAVIVGQNFLSKRANKLLGLILPALFFLASIIVCICFVLFGTLGNLYTITARDGAVYTFETIDQVNKFKETFDNDQIVSEELASDESANANIGVYVVPVLKLFFGVNVLTAILLIMYFHNKRHRQINQRDELKKMSIKDW